MNVKILDDVLTNANMKIEYIFLTDMNALAERIDNAEKYMCFVPTDGTDELIKYLQSCPYRLNRVTWVLCYTNKNSRDEISQILNTQGAIYKNGWELIRDVKDSKKIAEHVARLTGTRSAIDITAGNTLEYIDSQLFADIERLQSFGKVKTGFPKLDEISGGIEPDLYTVAAATSLGKTTFCLQIADNIASSGKDVLYFSLEQSRLEIVTKSFSRLLRQEQPTRHITALDMRHGLHPEELKHAIELYKATISDRMNVIEGNFSSTIDNISEFLDTYIKQTGRTPIVIIDYLQVIQPTAEQARLTTKELMKSIMTALKQLCIHYTTAIFVISSLNRASYLQSVSFESLKESGDIEYTAAVVWGLQFDIKGIEAMKKDDEKREAINRARSGDSEDGHREIKLVCLKNRSGKGTYETEFKYYPDSDLYVQEVDGLNVAYGKVPHDTEKVKKLKL